MIEQNSKSISLEDFPDYTFIYLEEEYRKQLFFTAYNLFGSLTKLAEVINVSPNRLSCWFRGEQRDYHRNKVGLQFIPLSKIKLISKHLIENNAEEFSMKNIGNHVLMYRMQAGNPIKNPNFPIIESPKFVRLLFHLIGDGYSGRKGDVANYRNTCTELLEEFKQDLKIFGDVPIYEQEYSIKFPRLLAQLIEDFYGIKCFAYESYISNKIFNISKENLCFGIRAFADDEGTVYSNSIRLTSANSNLLGGIKKILEFLEIRSNSIKFQQNPRAKYKRVYYLDIRDIERYSIMVGFTHPKKKELLKNYINKIKSRKRKRLLKS